MDKYTTIPKKDQADVLAVFWAMMREQEEQAYDNGSPLDRHLVESSYRLWNRVTGDNHQPRWMTNANNTSQI
jgi:hypothetical protein